MVYIESMAQVVPNQSAVSDLKAHTGFWLRFASNHVSQNFARKLLTSGVTVAEWVVLREMYDHQTLAPSALAERLGMTRGAVSKLIDRLVAKKLVSCYGRNDDRRYQEIALTPTGRRLVPELAAIADRNDAEFFAPLSERERKALLAALKKLAQAHSLHKVPTE